MNKAFDIENLVTEFNTILQITWVPVGSLKTQTGLFLEYLAAQKDLVAIDSKSALFKAINSKFGLNNELTKNFYRHYALRGFTFNYHQKLAIKDFINTNDIIGLKHYLSNDCEITTEFFDNDSHRPLTENEILDFFNEIYNDDKRKDEICSSLFSAYVFHLCEIRSAHDYFTKFEFTDKPYHEDFFEHLLNYEPSLLKRKEGLRLLKIDENLLMKFPDLDSLSEIVFKYIHDSYTELSNHSYLSIYIQIPDSNSFGINKWNLISQIELFAEKFLEGPLKIGYFHPTKIEEVTKQYIPLGDVEFTSVNEGFTYKDCFVISRTENKHLKKSLSFEQYDLLLLMEKNQRDERVVPCPACRSKNVRGNSYPTIGVKSWECCNDLCPDKSKFNRGKRYSLSSLIKQEAIDNEENLISPDSIKKWRLDVTTITNEREVIEFLIRHYSLVNDTIVVTNFAIADSVLFNRKIRDYELENVAGKATNVKFLQEGVFFKRIYGKYPTKKELELKNICPMNGIEIYNADCLNALQQFAINTFDGAVTSPPYYNAKSYSKWPNIYCYLYDMHNINREVFRVLKEGGLFLYNIFDYFDNENNVVFSAMGKKRLILGSYILDSFRKIGFEILGNIIWFKGEIQGKRNFNQGNFSPYYQAPLNAYEHIFVLSKPPKKGYKLPQILFKKPVFKIINGQNVVGHEAPYPEAIPNLLFDILGKDAAYILDPFGGTMTTAKAAIKRGISSVCIEKSSQYCQNEIKSFEYQLSAGKLF